ncbi:MAG: hypothetical protein IPH85_14420 [Ignavibacteria bacterium]|nr:hypothetical protein [Ignavibacteria bacterium]MBK7187083.1 hypothetical protein [Ignavibacteria bacterium]MBK9182083.1 hypothetical protein [Ignavibacteria bacterium]
MIPFEFDNVRAYELLLRIEISLRELLKSTYEDEYGKKWRSRLPGELLKKVKASQTEENRPQFGYARLGPLYYLTFGELLILLKQKPGSQVAMQLGGEVILKQLENILVPRNAVCHSRPVSTVGLQTIETLYAEMETALTRDGLTLLISETDTGISLDQACPDIVSALKCVVEGLPNLPASFIEPEVFETARAQYWWAEDSLAGFNRSVVEAAIELVRDYNSLPTGVGCAATRQGFIEQRDMKELIHNAIIELEQVRI